MEKQLLDNLSKAFKSARGIKVIEESKFNENLRIISFTTKGDAKAKALKIVEKTMKPHVFEFDYIKTFSGKNLALVKVVKVVDAFEEATPKLDEEDDTRIIIFEQKEIETINNDKKE